MLWCEDRVIVTLMLLHGNYFATSQNLLQFLDLATVLFISDTRTVTYICAASHYALFSEYCIRTVLNRSTPSSNVF